MGIIQLNNHRILRKNKQVICIIYPNSMPDIMILAKTVLQILAVLYKITKLEREIIQPNIDRILPKVNQVIYTLDTICGPNIMILAQAVLYIFC